MNPKEILETQGASFGWGVHGVSLPALASTWRKAEAIRQFCDGGPRRRHLGKAEQVLNVVGGMGIVPQGRGDVFQYGGELGLGTADGPGQLEVVAVSARVPARKTGFDSSQ